MCQFIILSEKLKGNGQLHDEWLIQAGKKKFKMRSYRMCVWDKVVFVANNKKFYVLEKIPRQIPNHLVKDFVKGKLSNAEKNKYADERKEYFDGQLKREYIGKKNCFVEFVEVFIKKQLVFTENNFSQIAFDLGFKKDLAKLYISYFQKFFTA